ncbi:MAG: TlpA disulfide reductase family protein [Sulfuricella sp.]|nr:TlpA disulfide reductase family protein [Sulfuricella sp.]
MSAKSMCFLAAWMLTFGLFSTPAAADALPAAEPVLTATLAGLDGKPLALAGLKGKVAVVNFWATWCTPCRTEIPALEDAYKKYGPRGVAFVGAAVEDDADLVREFAQANGITYPVAMAGKEKGIALLQALGNKIAGLPYTVVLDRQGNVLAVKRGILTPQRLQQILEPAL